MTFLQSALEGDVQEEAGKPEEKPTRRLLDVDRVPLVLPNARHLLLWTISSQESSHSPSHVVEENYLKKDEADPNENHFVILNIIIVENLVVFAVWRILEKAKSPPLVAAWEDAPGTTHNLYIYEADCRYVHLRMGRIG